MRAISDRAHAAIKGYLEAFIDTVVKEHKGRQVPALGSPAEYLAQRSPRGQLKPFHAAIIPAELLRINEFERGFSTSLGTTFEECARIIASEHHAAAHRSYKVTGEVSVSAIDEIERQREVFEDAAERKGMKPGLTEMIGAVLAARDHGEVARRAARADLHIVTRDGEELFFEMKSPQPNKGQCLEVIERILRFHLIKGEPRPRVRGYYAMAYNPFGPTREDYRWSIVRTYAPFEHAVMIGPEFWSVVGGPTTYEELLEIYQEVGRDKTEHIIDALAFDF